MKNIPTSFNNTLGPWWKGAMDGGPGSGPHPGGGKESSHPTHPLPDSPGSKFQYDDPDGYSHDVEKKATGEYYGNNEKFDFSAPHAEGMREKLKGWGAKYAGVSHK